MTETIAVVFTDLVDSTQLLASLGGVAFDEVRREHFLVLRSVIADTEGVEVKNLADGSASRSVMPLRRKGTGSEHPWWRPLGAAGGIVLTRGSRYGAWT